ncbi:MAG: alpha/beta hydrolase [Rhodocyclales bacterium]|nr:alpha/beta hydrolase [Rhodocyclales bacterium]
MQKIFATLTLLLASWSAMSADTTRTIDLPTRPGVTQRVLVITPESAKAVLVMFTGGNGALRLSPSGELGMGKGNFLIRTRQQWADKGFVVAMVDAPSDRQSEPFLSGYRQTPEHVTDIKAVIASLRQSTKLPIWLVGTSRGTQSVAFVTAALDKSDGPDGLVLTSTILNDPKSRSVPAMALEKITVPTLVVHHQQDACRVCDSNELPGLMSKLGHASRRELVTFEGGITQGDPCEAFAYHGFNGIEPQVVNRIAGWVLGQ